MDIYNLYVTNREMYLTLLKEELERENKDYVLIENELHYQGAIFRFFPSEKQEIAQEDSLIIQVMPLEDHLEEKMKLEASLQNISLLPPEEVIGKTSCFGKQEANPIYMPHLSKKKQLKRMNRQNSPQKR